MAGWGTPWGDCGLWGVGLCQDEICEFADGRVLVQIDDATGNRKFRDMICDLVNPMGHFNDVMRDISQAFDISTATGDRLDKIGSVLGLRRQGFSDTDYRTLLQIQADLLRSVERGEANWTGTAESVISIIRTFIGPAAPAIVVTNLPPYGYTLSIPTITQAQLEVLVTFICRATYMGVLGWVYFALSTVSVWDSETAGPAITNSGNWDSETAGAPIATPLVWGFTVSIGAGGSC